MPLLAEIATAQASLQHNLAILRANSLANSNVSCQFYPGLGRKFGCLVETFEFPVRVGIYRAKIFAIQAVAALESNALVINDAEWNGRSKSALDNKKVAGLATATRNNAEDLEERERIRRMRISKANKGNTPWNKGRKHSPETLQRIRERTKLAMQDPKVKVKLANLGHAQSDETKLKIAVGVRLGWQKRREKLMLQELCFFEWQNLVSEASRKGYTGEEELQWHSYDAMREKLELEWVESVEIRKTTKSISSRRAPKSAEQKRKIAEAIAAKWADPEYRERVCSGISKYHGSLEGAPKKPRQRPSGIHSSSRQGGIKLKENIDINQSSKSGNPIIASRIRKSKSPLYKDPLARSKLEMLKNIRAQRAVEENKKYEAIERARLLIAEAEKAAQALELAATRSPFARASLLETRKLIAEAVRTIESVNSAMISSGEMGNNLPNGLVSMAETTSEDCSEAEEKIVNGNSSEAAGFEKDEITNVLDSISVLNGNKSSQVSAPPDRINGFTSSFFEIKDPVEYQNSSKQVNGIRLNDFQPQKNIVQSETGNPHQNEKTNRNPATKKWVRGRLVEVSKDD